MKLLTEFGTAFIFSALFIWFLKRYAHLIGLIDTPNSRSVHTAYTPLGAGIGFYAAFLLTTAIYHWDMLSDFLLMHISILIVLIVGIVDDRYQVTPKVKFFILGIAAVFASFDGFVIEDVGVFFGVHITLGWLSLPFTVFAITGFTNAMNLIDGIDGLAATIALVIFGALFMTGYHYHDIFLSVISILFIAVLLAFLLYNWYPASVFMGDSGSLTIGFVISLLSIRALEYLPPVSILFVTAIPLFDTLIAMIRRKLNGRPLFAPDRCHLHHLIKYFFAQDIPKTVFFFAVMQAVYSVTGLTLKRHADEGYLLLLFILNTVMLYMIISAMIKKQRRKC